MDSAGGCDSDILPSSRAHRFQFNPSIFGCLYSRISCGHSLALVFTRHSFNAQRSFGISSAILPVARGTRFSSLEVSATRDVFPSFYHHILCRKVFIFHFKTILDTSLTWPWSIGFFISFLDHYLLLFTLWYLQFILKPSLNILFYVLNFCTLCPFHLFTYHFFPSSSYHFYSLFFLNILYFIFF